MSTDHRTQARDDELAALLAPINVLGVRLEALTAADYATYQIGAQSLTPEWKLVSQVEPVDAPGFEAVRGGWVRERFGDRPEIADAIDAYEAALRALLHRAERVETVTAESGKVDHLFHVDGARILVYVSCEVHLD